MTHVLGLSTTTTALLSTGANVLVPGSGPIVAVSAGVLTNLFGGAGRDAARQARETWFEQAARQGSLTAARVLIGGTLNTSSNERPMYQAGIQRLLSDAQTAPLMQAAQARGPYWDTTDDDISSKTRAVVENELEANAETSPFDPGGSSVPGPTGTAQRLPGMTTTARAPTDWTPWLIGAGGLLAALVLPRIISPSRRR